MRICGSGGRSPCNHVCGDECISEELICEKTEHTHTEECYAEALICELEEHTHGAECYEIINQCQHVHDEECEYVEAVEGQPCQHTCEECETTEEESDVRITALTERVNALPIEEEIAELTEEQKEALLAELNEIGEYLDNY